MLNLSIFLYIKDMTKTAVSCVPLIDLDQFSETAIMKANYYIQNNALELCYKTML